MQMYLYIHIYNIHRVTYSNSWHRNTRESVCTAAAKYYIPAHGYYIILYVYCAPDRPATSADRLSDGTDR